MFTDRQALEEILTRRKEAPKILHLATHGFFLSDLQLKGLRDTKAFGRDIHPDTGPPVDPKIKLDDPLLRSGLALAGANNALGSPDEKQSDGLLTAEKVLGLRLQGTDLVVLSACNTGQGQVQAGESVYGLRRAFVQAGTKGLVMSMWPVPDLETKELMVRFYKNIRSGRMNRVQALRQAALKQMLVVKDRYGYANPLFWGAFVYLGEPG